MVHFERDYAKAKKGEAELIYTSVMGMKPDFSGPTDNNFSTVIPDPSRLTLCPREDNEISDDDDKSDSDSEGSSEETAGSKFSNAARPKDETLEQKRVLLLCCLFLLH